MLYLPPFKKAIDAGALSVMSAYNAYDNVPASANHHLLTEILKEEWDWDGYIYSDWAAVAQLFNGHNVAENCYDAAEMAFNAGLVSDGLVPVSRLDDAVSRILRAKFKLGLFENPYVYPDWSFHLRTPISLALSYETTVDSLVLLQNHRRLLPLDLGAIRSIAVVGPLANSTSWQYGDYTFCHECQPAVSPLQGIKNFVGNGAEVGYAQGAWVWSFDETLMREAKEIARKSDVAVVVVGDYTDGVTNSTDGETFDTSELRLMGG
ncbi:glycoside hydrolase superfamily, partial [Jimgerdemannia flammicorona]